MECPEIGRGELPEIQINEEIEKVGSDTKNGHNIELLEEIDEMGSFVEDQKIVPETVIKTHMVGFFFRNRPLNGTPKVNSKFKMETPFRFPVTERHISVYWSASQDFHT